MSSFLFQHSFYNCVLKIDYSWAVGLHSVESADRETMKTIRANMKEYELRQKLVIGKYAEELVISDVLSPLSPLYSKLTPMSCEVCKECNI